MNRNRFTATFTAEQVRRHYEEYPYPHYPLIASVQPADACHLNLNALWAYFNNTLPPHSAQRILIAGSGTFAPYPFSIANPQSEITALDLSEKSLRRARLHCLLHWRMNVLFETADLCQADTARGLFGMIDAFGVLHHLYDPCEGLIALEKRLAPGGIMRVMVYSRYARREEESIRRAFRMLKVRELKDVKNLLKRSRIGSRLSDYALSSPEARYNSGIVDALLHPSVHTYKIDEFLELLKKAALVPLRFTHPGALPDPEAEVMRIRDMEARHESPGNFVVYLGREKSESELHKAKNKDDSMIQLNTSLSASVGLFCLKDMLIDSKFGGQSVRLDRKERNFLRKFMNPVPWQYLSDQAKQKVTVYRDMLFLLQYVQ